MEKSKTPVIQAMEEFCGVVGRLDDLLFLEAPRELPNQLGPPALRSILTE